MLNYLDDSFAKLFMQLGITILVTGFEMAFSISFIILLVFIFNSTIDIRENQNKTNNININNEI